LKEEDDMKIFIMTLALIGLIAVAPAAHAEETLGEKAAVAGNSTKRAFKKGVNRSAEALCGKLTGDSKISCMAKEAKNRASETKDVVVDKGSEVINAVDSEKK
jgi:hypothetical protein